jgi:hypothetical protein
MSQHSWQVLMCPFVLQLFWQQLGLLFCVEAASKLYWMGRTYADVQG